MNRETLMVQGSLERKVRAQGKHAQLVVLEGKTQRARNRLNEARWDMLKWNGEWTTRWRVLERRDLIPADPRKGPFLLVTPEGDTDDSKHSRWVHATEDKNFKVDDSAGDFVEVRQQIGKIAINHEEWPILREAIDRMIAECRK